MEHVILDSLRKSKLCKGLPDERLNEIAGLVSYQDHDIGHMLFRSGDPADRFFVVLEGHVALTVDDAPRAGTIARIVHAGESFAETSICGQGAYGETAEALSPVRLAVFPGSVLCELLVQRFDLVIGMLGNLSIQLRGLVRQISDLKMKTAAQRLASHLLSFTDAKAGPTEVHLPYARKILAQELGMQPETMSRAFLKLQPLGVRPLRNRDVCRIADVAALHAFCEDDGADR